MNTDTKSKFKIYRSSAGSGKTYQLALEYLSLAIRNPTHFDKVLAVTFTNKATKEMKDRILDFLIGVASGKNEELTDQLQLKTGMKENEISGNAKIVISKILHQYSKLSVSTIDAFFQKIVKSFARELGLLGNYKVEMDLEKVKQEIIDYLIEDVGKNIELTGWLIDFSYSKVDENRSWNIRPQIEILADEIFKDSFRPIEKELSKLRREDLTTCLKQLLKIKKQFESHMIAEARRALKLINSHGLSTDDFSYKSSGPAGYFVKVLKSSFQPGKRFLAAVADQNKWTSKSSNKSDEINELLEEGLQIIAESMLEYYNTQIVSYSSVNEVLSNIYVFGILYELTKKLKAFRLENDVMLISDVSIFLNDIISENETPFIYEKVGTWYRNYLIDEFQDTSDFQWQNFRPLVENSLAQGNPSLLVGDGKQSIYRWRGGDWNLLLNQVGKELQLFQPKELYLKTNWRSSKGIVSFNNALFSLLPGMTRNLLLNHVEEASLSDKSKNVLIQQIADLEKLYDDVIQEVSPKNSDDNSGRIEINAFQKTDGLSWKDRSMDELIKTIERLQKRGYSARDIAVLVRRGDEGKAVLEHLLQHKRSEKAIEGICYDAISNESLFLGNSSAIRLITQTIVYCLNPEDKIALGEICYHYNYFREIEGAEIKPDSMFSEDILPSDFMAVCEEIMYLPVYEMVERIIQFFHLEQNKAHLQAFQDLVLEYFSSEKTEINDFLNWWQDKGKRESIQLPEEINAIQVMTIHKSKGLEFKAVLLPFCDWNLDHEPGKNNFLWCRSTKDPFHKIGFFPVRYKKELANSFFAKEYFDEKIKAHVDNLNLLYVALTRAEAFLMINCPPVGGNQVLASNLILDGIEDLANYHREDQAIEISEDCDDLVKYSMGRIDSMNTNQTPNPIFNYRTYRSSGWREKIALRKKGGLFLTEEGKQKKAKINYGILVHEILERIQDQAEAKSLINQYYLRGEISSEDKQVLLNQLEQIFSCPQVKSWFNTDWKVKVESSIIIQNQHPKRPDRVLMKGSSAIIIDFKSGIEKPVDRRQVLSYMETMANMGYREIQAFLLYTANNKVVQVV